MLKFFKNIFKLLKIKTPFFIFINFIFNFLPNYKTKRKSRKIENTIYKNFVTYDSKSRWFCNNLYFLTKSLKNFDNINEILEIGSYEGRSAIFFLNYFKDSKITCIDTWFGSDEHDKKIFVEIEKNFLRNVETYINSDRLKYQKISSNDFFNKNTKKYDLIFLDGDHSFDQVFLDANNAWQCLNVNGYLIFDDYLWWYYSDTFKNPSSAINKFLIDKKNKIEIIKIWHQVIIKKIIS